MAVTIGTGEASDLHPINKWDVGRRLALLAARLILEGQECPPVCCERAEARGLWTELKFTREVKLIRQENSYFTAVYADGTEETVDAEQLSGRSLRLTISRESPAVIRYAWMPSPTDPQLWDTEGMPVSPFEIRTE